MGTSSNAIFTGSSQFSQDFQNVITRAVKIASLPISQLNDDLTALQNESSALSGIDTKFAALQTAVNGIQDAVAGASFQATVSDPSVASVNLGDGVIEGNYSIEVLDAGAFSTSLTASSWVNVENPPGETHTYQLWIGSTSDPANEIDITSADNSAQSVAAAINAKAGDKVRAVAVNVGSADTPDWRISLQSTSLDNQPLDIQDGGTSLQAQTPGHAAQYIVNNSGLTVTSSTRSVAITSGLNVTLLTQDPGHPVNITVVRSTSALANALTTFTSAYNAVVDSLDQQRGQNAGALSGNSVINSLSQALAGIATYAPQGTQFGGLRDLGLELGADGHLTFNSLQLMAADFANSPGVTAFFGSTEGGGFLQSANDLLNGVVDSQSGILKNVEAGVQSQIKDTNTQIAAKQDQVNQLEERLQEQMAAADAAIASMEQQYSYLSNMFQAMQVADQLYK